MKRASFLAVVGAFLFQRRRATAQTRMNPRQVLFPAQPTPTVIVSLPTGEMIQAKLGVTMTLQRDPASGAYFLDSPHPPSQPAALGPVQLLTAEPDGASWRIPSPAPNLRIHCNGLLCLPGTDYAIEASGAVVRPTAAYGSASTDRWTAA